MKYKFKSEAIEKIVKSFADAHGIPQEMVDKSAEIAIKLGVGFSLVACGSYLALNSDCVQEVKEYNPNDWNNYPEVTPPEGAFMRVETIKGFRYGAKFDGKDWISPVFNSGATHNFSIYGVVRFRPWDED